MSDVDYILKMLPSEYDFNRMLAHGNMSSTYENFVDRNEKIIRELPADDLGFLRRLCGIINTSRINLTDMESCVEFKADGIYYNREGELCIFNPR